MIKFKEFDVGDIHYEEQIEQFQKEHQNAEFVQITGGYTSYEKIWFKYDDGIEQQKLNENQQIVLDWLKDEYCDGNPFFTIWHTLEDRYFKESSDALLASQQIEILQAFSQWAIEQEEV